MKHYQLFVTTECSYCQKAVSLLEKYDKKFIVTAIDKAPQEVVRAIKEQYHHLTVPIILEVSGKGLRKVGGFQELEKEFGLHLPAKKYSDMTDEEKKVDELYHDHGHGD